MTTDGEGSRRAVLADRPFVAFLLVADPDRARAFYCDLLGLTLVHQDPYAVVVDAGGTPLRLAVVASVPEPVGTDAGWLVDDVAATARALAAAGVALERFPGMDQDDDGVWRSSDGSAVAWFRDPDGNRLSVSEAG